MKIPVFGAENRRTEEVSLRRAVARVKRREASWVRDAKGNAIGIRTRLTPRLDWTPVSDGFVMFGSMLERAA